MLGKKITDYFCFLPPPSLSPTPKIVIFFFQPPLLPPTLKIVYICFGSMANFTASQLKEIAAGLEASGHQFIRVFRRRKKRVKKTRKIVYLKDLRKEWKAKGYY